MQEFYEKKLKRYGYTAQMIKVVEELAELQQAVCKLVIHAVTGDTPKPLIDDIIEETADVEIMMYQLKAMLGIAEDVKRQIEHKMEVRA